MSRKSTDRTEEKIPQLKFVYLKREDLSSVSTAHVKAGHSVCNHSMEGMQKIDPRKQLAC